MIIISKVIYYVNLFGDYFARLLSGYFSRSNSYIWRSGLDWDGMPLNGGLVNPLREFPSRNAAIFNPVEFDLVKISNLGEKIHPMFSEHIALLLERETINKIMASCFPVRAATVAMYGLMYGLEQRRIQGNKKPAEAGL